MRPAYTVILIIGLGMANSTQATPYQSNPAQSSRTMLKLISDAIQTYSMIHRGKLPESLEELTQGTEENPPFLEKETLIDSWGEPFGYEYSDGKFTLWTTGRDKIMGTQDDIVAGSTNLYVKIWRGRQVQSGMDAEAAEEALPEWVLTRPPPVPALSPEEQARREEEGAKETEWLLQQVEESRRAHKLFLRNVAVACAALILGICAAAVWAFTRKKAGRE